MSSGFSLRISAGPVCRTLAGDVARRYVELAGGREAEAAALSSAVVAATDAVTSGERPIDLTFSRGSDTIDVDVSCGSRHERCRSTVPQA